MHHDESRYYGRSAARYSTLLQAWRFLSPSLSINGTVMGISLIHLTLIQNNILFGAVLLLMLISRLSVGTIGGLLHVINQLNWRI